MRVHLWLLLTTAAGCAGAVSGPAPPTGPTGHDTPGNVPGPASVSSTWFESTVKPMWPAVPGATGYRVTLIRVRDQAIMEQKDAPATQLAYDLQGIWPLAEFGQGPNEQYQVAVQSLDAAGRPGQPTLSTPGESVSIDRRTFNGFLDLMDTSEGYMDTDLWDQHVKSRVGVAGSFINPQLHGHLEIEAPEGDQSLTTMRSRVPVDWTGRTVTISGQIDLHSDDKAWFGAYLSPQALGPDRILDLVDRCCDPRTMPVLGLFDFGSGGAPGELHLLYAVGDGSMPMDLGSVRNPMGYVNVRSVLVWQVSTTHVKVTIDGATAFDMDLPSPLTVTRGYLTLAAETYPGSGGTTSDYTTCDQPGGGCGTWHLDDWGWDAPAGQVQPQSAAHYAVGCGPMGPSLSALNMCGNLDLAGGGSSASTTVTVPDASSVTSAAVVLEALALTQAGELQVRVNGGPWQTPAYFTDRNTGENNVYLVPFDPALLRSGANTIDFQRPATAPGFTLGNIQIETLSSIAYAPPPLPAELPPIGTW